MLRRALLAALVVLVASAIGASTQATDNSPPLSAGLLLGPWRRGLSRAKDWATDQVRLIKHEIDTKAHYSKEQLEEVRELSSRLGILTEAIHEEEVELERLQRERREFEVSRGTWFLKPALYREHEESSFQIARLERDLANKVDELHLVWRRIKGVVGPYSMLFAVDVGAALVSPLVRVAGFALDTFFGSLFLSLFFFFPTIALFARTFALFRTLITPLLGVIYVVSVGARLPELVLAYHPGLPELAGFLLLGYLVLLQVARLFIPVMEQRAKVYLVTRGHVKQE